MSRSSVGWLVAWTGVVGIGLVALLAALHLGADLVQVARALAGGNGSPTAVALTVAVTAASVVVFVMVARLAGSTGSRERVAILVGFILLVAIRIVIAAVYDGVPDGELKEYDQLARGVLEGDCCFANRPMGYSIVLSLVYRVMGPGHLAVASLNILFAILTGALLVVLARRLYGPRVAALSLVGYALWPAGALMVVTSMPHSAYDLAVVATALAAIGTAPGWRGSALTGALLAVAHYLRPSTPALLPVYLLARIWPGSTWRRLIGGTLLPMAVAFLVLLLPVLDHNLSAHGELSVSTSAYGGHGLYVGTDARSGGRWTEQNSSEVLALPGADFWERSRRAGELAMERVRSDPVGITLLGIRKQDTLWGTERYGVQYAIRRSLADSPEHPATTLASITSSVFYVLASAGAAMGSYLRRRDPDVLMVLLVGMVVAVSLAHALLEVRDRYHAYVVPLMIPIAAIAAVRLLERLGLLRDPGGDAPAEVVDDSSAPHTSGSARPSGSAIMQLQDGAGRAGLLGHTLHIRVGSLPRPCPAAKMGIVC